MIKSLQRQLQKMDQDLRISFFETNMRLLLQKLHWNVDASMRILIRYQRELAPCMGDGRWPGCIDPEGYDLIHRLVPPDVRNAPPDEPDPDAEIVGPSAPVSDDRKLRAIDALVDQHPHYHAAEIAGVSRVTLWRWMQQPSFLEALAEAKHEAFWQSFGILDRHAAEITAILTQIAGDQSIRLGNRMQAGSALLQLGELSLAQLTLEAQISKMEEALIPLDPPCNVPPPNPDPPEPQKPININDLPVTSAPANSTPDVAKRRTIPNLFQLLLPLFLALSSALLPSAPSARQLQEDTKPRPPIEPLQTRRLGVSAVKILSLATT